MALGTFSTQVTLLKSWKTTFVYPPLAPELVRCGSGGRLSLFNTQELPSWAIHSALCFVASDTRTCRENRRRWSTMCSIQYIHARSPTGDPEPLAPVASLQTSRPLPLSNQRPMWVAADPDFAIQSVNVSVPLRPAGSQEIGAGHLSSGRAASVFGTVPPRRNRLG